MQLDIATTIAANLIEQLEPFCERIEVGGSIRRKKSAVKDIEIICIPKTIEIPGQINIFGATLPAERRDPDFCKVVDSFKFVKGPSLGKYMARDTADGHRIDIFTATAINWGYILFLRTGSTAYNLEIIEALRGHGCRCGDGKIFKNGVEVPIREEAEIFKLCYLDYVPAEKREAKAKYYTT